MHGYPDMIPPPGCRPLPPGPPGPPPPHELMYGPPPPDHLLPPGGPALGRAVRSGLSIYSIYSIHNI